MSLDELESLFGYENKNIKVVLEFDEITELFEPRTYHWCLATNSWHKRWTARHPGRTIGEVVEHYKIRGFIFSGPNGEI